jgi:hypothetical protein
MALFVRIIKLFQFINNRCSAPNFSLFLKSVTNKEYMINNFYIGHPVVFNELQDKQTVYSCCQTFEYPYFNGDVFRSFPLSSGHLTES